MISIKLKAKVAIKKNKIHTKKRFWAGILLAQFLLFFICSRIKAAVKLFEQFFEWQKAFHQKLFSVLSFSVGDVFYILIGLLFLIFIIKILRKKTRNTYSRKLLIMLNLLYFIYQLFWGMLYFQTPLREKLPKGEITVAETKRLTLKYLKLCRETRSMADEDKNGVFKVDHIAAIEDQILQNQNKLPAFITSKKGTSIKMFKPSLYKGVMSYSGILGYYNPFTAEAQYNPELPATYLPFTLAHEGMHQLGFAREQEANFTAYLIGKSSENTALRYSTQYFVLKSLLNSLNEKNPEFVAMVLQNYSEGMKRDRLAEKRFKKEHEGLLDIVFGLTNDLFLKSNQQEGSITYSYFVDLLIRYERLGD